MIGIVILNYMNYHVTLNCIKSVFENITVPDYQIIIVDNGSTNESVDVLKATYSSYNNITILALPKNLGFACGNNEGIKQCIDYGIEKCILTNSDIVFKPNTIEKLIDDVSKENIVIVGPKIKTTKGMVQHSSRLKKGRCIDPLEIGRFFPTKRIDEENGRGIIDVFSVSGCCFAIDITLFKKMGAFDSNTFLYNEENILGMQALSNKLRIMIDLDVEVIHNHGASSGKDNDFVRSEYIKSTIYYWRRYRNKNRFFLYVLLLMYVLKLKYLNRKELNVEKIFRIGKKYIKTI